MTYWRKAVLEMVSTESEEKELVDLAPIRVSLIHKNKSVKTVIDEIMKEGLSQGFLFVIFQPKSLLLKQ